MILGSHAFIVNFVFRQLRSKLPRPGGTYRDPTAASDTGRLARVEKERGLARAEIEARIAAQIGDDERRRRATIVIDNGGSLEELRRTVERLYASATSSST